MDIYDKILNAVKTVVKNKTSGYDTPAVVTRVDGDTAWVHIDGGVQETPVDRSIACKKGDSVRVRLSGGGAFITGNDTRPPTDDATALIAESKAEQSYSKAVTADEKAIVAENRAIDAKYTAESILVYDHTYTVENNIATFVAYLYRGGLDVKNLYSSDLFTWYLKTESGTTYLGTGYTKSVNLNACGYGAEVIGRFHSDDDELLAYNGNNLTDVNDTPLTGRANGEATRVRDLEVVTTLDDGEKFMIVGNDDEHLITASTLAEYLESQTTETDPVFSASPASGILASDIIAWNNKSDFSGSYNDLTDKPTIPTVPTNVSAFTNDAGYITGYTETDPTVPSWAKASSKPSYTASEVGAQPTLVSGTNIKTVNNNSLLGSGNVSITPDAQENLKFSMYDEDPVYGEVVDCYTNSGEEDWYLTVSSDVQPTLVSGTNIKTINNTSILGSGNISISGGGVTGVKGNAESTYRTGNVNITPANVGAVPTTRTVNGKALSSNVTLKTSDLTNDSGYITGYTETDPTVPSWAKASSKPSYTASEVGAVPTSRTVNSKALSSDISLTASDVSALPLSGGTLTGTLKFTENTVEANFRPANADYYSTISHLTSGNEATVFATKNAVTSFMFVNGEDSVTNHASNRWQSLTPALQIKNNKIAIGKLIANGVTPTYALDVNGTVNATSFEGSGSELTGVVHTETDPTVPSWAKASSKPSYTASEVGAVPTSRTVNGHALTGNVAVTTSDLSIDDYITATGHDSTGKWFYTRWASGKEESWGTISSGTLTMSASGSLYRATGKSITVPSGVLNNTPTFVEVNAMYSSAVFVNAMGSASSKTALSVQIWKSTNATAAVDLMIHTVYYPSSY